MGITPNRQPRSSRGIKPFQPAIGRDFGTVEEVEAKTRGFLARFLALATAVGVAVTGGYGLVTGNYTAVIGFWAVAGPIVGAMVAHYFGSHRKDS